MMVFDSELFLLGSFDKMLAFVALTLFVSFFGTHIIKKLMRKFRGPAIFRFLLFTFIILFGINVILLFLVNLLVSITGIWKWVLIMGLIFICFLKFNYDMKN